MNPNRQNPRFGGCGCDGRSGGRPVAAQNCNIINTASCCETCGAGNVGGIIIGQQCGDACNRETVLQGMPIAMAYVPWQRYDNIYPLSQALQNGTMFCELNLEFAGRRCN